MKVKVESVWTGGSAEPFFRLTFQHKGRECRESVNRPGNWRRGTASWAKEKLSILYGFNPRNIRFDHR